MIAILLRLLVLVATVSFLVEQRTLTIGVSNQARLLVVVWTQRENIMRIITAFFPTKSQEKEYINARG